MKLLLSKLRKHLMLILIIIGVLFIQAFSELALPDYMANIVNIGISQGGVENPIPEVLTVDTYSKLQIIANDKEKAKINSIYEKKNAKEVVFTNKTLNYIDRSKEIYVLKDRSVLEDEDLKSILAKNLLIFSGIENGMPSNLSETTSSFNFPKGEEGFNTLKDLSPQIKTMMFNKIDETFKVMDKKSLSAAASRSIVDEYKKLSIPENKIQNSYMFSQGLRMILIALVSLIASILVGFIASKIAADIGRELREDSFKKVMSFSNKEFDKFSTASLITRSNNDISGVQNMLVMLLRILFYAPILGLGGVYKAIHTNVSMAWIIALAVVLIIALVLTIFSFAMPLFKKVQTLVDKLQLVTREILNGLLVIRAFVNEDFEKERFKKANTELTDTNQRIANVMITMNPLLMLLLNGVMLLIVWVGAKEINVGNIRVGDMMAFMQYAMQIIMSFLMITMVSIMLPRASISLKRISEVLNEDTSIVNNENPIILDDRIDGKVEFKNVSFKFDNAPLNALEDINLTFNKGEVSAIIGSTGSGKSTLVNLIPRFYDVTEGEILIDGKNIKKIDLNSLRDKIGFVPQKATLFTGTIESNMKIGKNSDVDGDRITKSLEIAQGNEIVSKFDEGINHEISQGGTNLSGGQKQTLAIARAIAKRPEIYIFDDSFSALDFKTDLELRRALKEDAKDSTIIIVAQRIGTIINADKIVVLDEGKVVGVGKHEELIKNNEVYREIASSQLGKEAL